jgi:glycosyltransferase involved in cell wall biosynthesis
LARLLQSIALQDADNISYVIVADNEGAQGSARSVVEMFVTDNFPFPIKVISVEERGISQVRNALMQEAFENLQADNLAMVDDDEHVCKSWITELHAMQKQGSFDVVGGYVLPDFETSPPNWTKNLNLYFRPKLTAGKIDMVNGTTNVLLNNSVYKKFKDNKFDNKFSLTGGGDREFFTRLKQQTATFAFAPEAISHEIFAQSRLTLKWAEQRAYRIGAGDARIFRRYSSGYLAWLKELIKMLAAIVISILMMILTVFSPPKRVFYFLKIIRQRGKLNGLFGEPVEVYKQTHGS